MKTLFLGIILICSCICKAGELAEAISKNAADARSVYMRLQQEKYISLLDDKISTTISLAADENGRIRWQITAPFESVSILDKSALRNFEKSDGVWREIKSDADNKMRHSFEMIRSIVMGDFSKPINGFSIEEKNDHIILTPTNATIAKFISRISIFADLKTGVVSEISIDFPDGDYSKIKVSDFKKNSEDLSDAFDCSQLDKFKIGK